MEIAFILVTNIFVEFCGVTRLEVCNSGKGGQMERCWFKYVQRLFVNFDARRGRPEESHETLSENSLLPSLESREQVRGITV